MSEPLFEVTVKVTPETCHALAKARAGQHSKIIWLCNAVIALCSVILWSIRSPHALWTTILLALLLLHAFLRVRLTAWWLYSTRNESVDAIHMVFEDKGIRLRSRVEKTIVRYEMVTGLWEDERHMMITMRHHTPLVVAKAQLNGGQAEGLAQFLEKKTGLEIRHFRR